MKDHPKKHKSAVALFAMALLTIQVTTSQTMRGDFTMDGSVNITDAIGLCNYLLNDKMPAYDPAKTDTISVNGVSFVMVRVKGGTYSRELYVCHTLPDYSIGQTEVTRELWDAVTGQNNTPTSLYGNYPVSSVSWEECQEFVTTLNALTGLSFSLPTEDEWEYAACGGRNTMAYTYSGSNNIDEVAWYRDGSQHDMFGHPVAMKVPNELGLYDMSGNKAEMCLDYRGIVPGILCAVRGGGCISAANECKVTARPSMNTDAKSFDVGLRLVLHTTE